MFLKKNIIQHQQNIEKLIIDYKLLKKAMNFLYKKRIIKAGGINMEWWKKSVVYQRRAGFPSNLQRKQFQ